SVSKTTVNARSAVRVTLMRENYSTMREDAFHLELPNEIAELERLRERVEAFGAAMGLPQSVVFDVNLALEEIVANAMLYGFDDPGEGHTVRVDVSLSEGLLTARVEDEGRPFDPLQRPEPDLTLPIEERPIGGLGIFLTRKVMDEVAYERT